MSTRPNLSDTLLLTSLLVALSAPLGYLASGLITSATAQTPTPTTPTNDQLRPAALTPTTESRVMVLVNNRYFNASIDPATIAITANPGVNTGFTIKAIIPNVAPSSMQFKSTKFTGMALGTTTFMVVETGTSTVQGVQVYRNGLLLSDPDDYTVNTLAGASITANLASVQAATQGDVVKVTYWK